MNEVLVGATDNVVIRHSNGIDTATRCLQDMDAVKGPNVPDLGKSMSLNLRPGTYLPWASGIQEETAPEHVGGYGKGRKELQDTIQRAAEGKTLSPGVGWHTLIVW